MEGTGGVVMDRGIGEVELNRLGAMETTRIRSIGRERIVRVRSDTSLCC